MPLAPYHRPSPHHFAELEDFEDEPTSTFATLSAIVHPVVVVRPETPLGDVRQMFHAHQPPAIAVTDDSERLRGVITRSDALRAFEGCAAEVMTAGGFALASSATIESAALMMARESVSYVIVVGDGGLLVGMVSALDVLRHFVR